MKKHFVLSAISIALATQIFANQQTVQSVDVVNNSNQPIYLYANCPSHALVINNNIPSYTTYRLVSVMTGLKTALETLHVAILNDSEAQLKEAIAFGADINKLIDGRTPLTLALMLGHLNVAKYLLILGAR